ncbi:hypothetical protein ACTS91_16010 [Empedobacter falsenii]|uniref:hypothetical protein n=1 Tax=Empedobacter sp. GD03865 TaxID=2975392 RepID=UPI00244AA390|nr:hypothetical protein [Empedobacter sp. GD03865]MDH0660459.1 hypothetical protein [Empedobacter sp. GD03865]
MGTNTNPINENGLNIDLNDEFSKNMTVHKNVEQEIIITTSDKIELVLIKTKEILTSKRDWWTPFGLSMAFVTTLCTADFKGFLGLTNDTWKALFIFLTIAAFIWLIFTLIKLIKYWGKGDLKTIIDQIKLKEKNLNR